MADEDRRAGAIKHVIEMAMSGEYDDADEIEVALILQEVYDPHDFMRDMELRRKLDEICAAAMAKKRTE